MTENTASLAPVEEGVSARTSEAALLALLKKGHAGAFGLVIQRHNRRLYRVARSILGDEVEAEDVVQEAYVRALTNVDSFRGEASLSTWLTRIAINEALGRRRARRPAVELGVIDTVANDGNGAVPASLRHLFDEGPERAAARGEIRHLIEQAVEALPEAFRLVFVLRAVEGLSVEETALHLGIPQATVKTRFHRARRLLQEALDEMVSEVLVDAFPFGGSRCEKMTQNVLRRIGIAPDRVLPAGN